MLLNHIDYGIYYGTGCSEHRVVRRQSWPRGSAPVGRSAGPGLRVAIGHALIGLGRLIAADNRAPLPATTRH